MLKNYSARKTALKPKFRWRVSVLISFFCIIAALIFLLLAHLFVLPYGVFSIACPLVIGLIGAIAGIFAHNPALTGINLGLGFFLMPIDTILFGNLF
ncbi:hypothetical protein ccrud_00745 [Corynebacterium crudilactis]|uniref:Uncharacterized protein n=2 Tax=Corynebacterium crudilactis TaxID=1652495 RepID=A0A172QQC4_9CORY|nr:hypothetical protein ccrud_00745 [Corynebacterium crudilactis]